MRDLVGIIAGFVDESIRVSHDRLSVIETANVDSTISYRRSERHLDVD